jgi:hypothetical protein
MRHNSVFSYISRAALLVAAFGLADIASSNLPLFSSSIAHAQSANITLEKLVIPAGVYKFTLPKIEITGTNLTKAEFLAILDPKSKEAAKQRFAKLSFTDATIPELIVETKIGERADRQTYRNVKLSNAISGKIARISADGGAFESKATSKKDKSGIGAFKGVYDALSVEGLDLLAAIQVFGETSNDENAPMQTIYSGYTLNGFRFDMSSPDADIVFSGGKTSSGAFTAKAGKFGFLDFVEMLKETPDIDDMSDEEKTKFFNGLLQVFSNFDLGPWQMENLAMSMKVSEKKSDKKDEKKNIDFKIASIKVGHSDSNFRIDGIDMSIPDENISLKLASYDIKGYSLKPTLEAARAYIAKGKFEAEDIATIDFRDFMPIFGSSELLGLTMQAPDKKGDWGSDLIKIGIGQIKTSLSNQIKGIPTAFNYNLKNVTIDIPEKSPNEGVRLMRDNGIEKLDMSVKIDAKWVEERKEFAISDISASAEKLGSIKISGAIGNMPKELFSGSMTTAQMLALALTAKAAEVKIENKGFLELALKSAGRDKNKTPEEFKKELIEGVKSGLEKSFGENDKAKAVIAGFSTFLQNGKSLTVSVKPKADPQRSLDGIGAMDIFLAKEPKDILDKLDVDVKAE